MPRKILVVAGSGSAVDFIEVPADNEHELQQVMLSHPQLIPTKDLGLDNDLLVVGRETALASGSIDLLCLSSSGEVVIVEFKTGPKNPDFRHSLAQVIDYGSDIWRLSDWKEFDQGLVHRYLNGPRVDAAFKGCKDLEAAARRAWSLDDQQWQALVSRLDKVLETGDFHFVVAAQRFTDAMRGSVDYLNETARMGRYFLVELIRLDGRGQKAYAAQVVQRPGRRVGSGGSLSRASEDDFLARIGDSDYRDAMSELFANVAALGLSMAWGSKGASIRLKSPDRDEPISVGWVFLFGDQWTWAKHVTLGVDTNTLVNHPTVAPAILKFCTTVKAVAGAQLAGGKSNAAVFDPPAFVFAHAELIEALAALATDIENVQEP
ncbi:endonuclease NucS domain-containing protein [Nocardioides dongxiaopingii]|uniref:endonuclease NucS domain-containing protein n=1 Tax=Nocardioides dongxiaopingii TaxID=2576036 RepID=UPI00148551DA|nr:endonuclease NucS domain-containing protein [Nocardioides dongxiaopingii]